MRASLEAAAQADRTDGQDAEHALVHVRALASDAFALAELRAIVLGVYEPTARAAVRVGDRVYDVRLREGIVLETAAVPSVSWLAEQREPEMRAFASDPWWRVLVVGGGAVLAPTSLLHGYGRASRDDVLRVIEHATTVKRLLAIFPELRSV